MVWDRVAGVYDLFESIINRRANQRLQQIVAGLVAPAEEVLECACGTGLLTGVMAQRCRKLTATDFSEKMLAQARRKHRQQGNITFRQGNILALDFPDESFDAVVAANVIHLLDDPIRALRELERVCRRGGRIIVPTYMNPFVEGKSSVFGRLLGRIGAGCSIFRRHFTQETYRRFMEEAGYTQARYMLAQGHLPCMVAVIEKA